VEAVMGQPSVGGNAFEGDLAAGEVIDVEPGSWIYRRTASAAANRCSGSRPGCWAARATWCSTDSPAPGDWACKSGYCMPFAGGTGDADAGCNPVGGILGGLFNDR
jgi:hypothetical protein